jgi:MoxR-like ATPase
VKKFASTERYIAPRELEVAVNAAVALQRPLLVKGEPGTGKTVLAQEIARSLGLPLIEWHIKSTTKAQQGLYEYDAVSRLRDASSATSACATCPTTSSAASSGRPSPPRRRWFC